MRLRIKSDILIEHRNESKPNKNTATAAKTKSEKGKAGVKSCLKYAWVIMLRKSGYFSR